MVREVTAFQAEDGTVHKTELAALEADAMIRLKRMDCFNHGSAQAIIKQAEYVVDALAPLAKYINSRPVAEYLVDEPTEESL